MYFKLNHLVKNVIHYNANTRIYHENIFKYYSLNEKKEYAFLTTTWCSFENIIMINNTAVNDYTRKEL